MMLGGDPNGLPFKDWAFETWREKYGTKPPWIPKDYAMLANALKAYGGEEYARAAWRAFLASEEPFYAGHEPRKFLASMGRWSQPAKPQKQVGKDIYSERLKIMQAVDRDPQFTTEQQRRDEYARRARGG